MNHDHAYENLEGFVFGTLDTGEVTVVESHLQSGCEACHARLREISELSVQLAGAVPQHDPPPAMRHKLMTEIASRARREARRPAVDDAPRRSWWTIVVPALATAVAAVAVIVMSQNVGGLRRDIAALQTALDQSQDKVATMRDEMAAMNEASRLLGKPCTRLVDLAGVDPNPDAAGRFVVHPDEPVGVLYVYKMPPAPEGMQYQLWTLRDGQPHSVGLFTVAPDGSAVLRSGQLDDPRSISEFKVTIEPAGGRATPEGMLYLTGANTLGPMH